MIYQEQSRDLDKAKELLTDALRIVEQLHGAIQRQVDDKRQRPHTILGKQARDEVGILRDAATHLEAARDALAQLN